MVLVTWGTFLVINELSRELGTFPEIQIISHSLELIRRSLPWVEQDDITYINIIFIIRLSLMRVNQKNGDGA